MPFSNEDKIVIKHYRIDKGYGAKKLLYEFPNKGWTRGGLDYLIKKIDETGTVDRCEGSGRPRSVRTHENVQKVEERILSQETCPGTHMTPSQISKEIEISKSSIKRIIKLDLQLKTFKRVHGQKLTEVNCEKRVTISKRILRKFTEDKLSKTFFTDEKRFTVEPPRNSQNDRVYADVPHKNDIQDERLYATRSHFSASVMVSVGVSKLGKTPVFFIEQGVKINAEYYCTSLLHEMLPEMRMLAKGGYFLFQQDGATSHTAKSTIEYLKRNVPELLEPTDWPPNSPDLNPVDYGIWENLAERVYRIKIRDVAHLRTLIIEKWEEIPQEQVDRAINQFKPRLRKVVEVNGKHIEQFF